MTATVMANAVKNSPGHVVALGCCVSKEETLILSGWHYQLTHAVNTQRYFCFLSQLAYNSEILSKFAFA